MVATNPSEWHRLIEEQKDTDISQAEWRERFCAIMEQEQARMTTDDILLAIKEGTEVMAQIFLKERQRMETIAENKYTNAHMIRLVQEVNPGNWQADLHAMLASNEFYGGHSETGNQHYNGVGFDFGNGGGGVAGVAGGGRYDHGHGGSVSVAGGRYSHGHGTHGGGGSNHFAFHGHGYGNGGHGGFVGWTLPSARRQRPYRYWQKSYISTKSFLDQQQRGHDGDGNRPR